jgi:hypothetical protein
MDAVLADPAILGFGFSFADLATRDGLVRLDRLFLDRIAGEDAALYPRLLAARAAPDAVTGPDESELVVALAPHLDAFVAALFGIEAETLALAHATHALDPIHACKRLFVQRQAVKKYPDPAGFDGAALRADLETRFGGTGCSVAICRLGNADRGGPRSASRQHPVPRAAPAGLQSSGSG